MRRLELLIEAARSESLNKDYSVRIGIPQDDFVRFANEAQERLFSEAVKTHPKFFLAETIIETVAGQEAYQLPDDCHLGHVEMVEYSSNGNPENFYRLEQAKLPERASQSLGDPGMYIRRGKELLLVSIPASSGAKVRVTYVRQPRRVEIRRGAIAVAAITGTQLDGLTLSSLASLDPTNRLALLNHLSIVDRDGLQNMKAVEYDSIDVSTGVVTLTGGSHQFDSHESIAAGSFVVLGKNSVNVSDLPESCDRYLIKWMAACALERDGSVLEKRKRELCSEMLGDIVGSFSDIEHDVSYVTILTTDLLELG
jgi:hypothetical protein